MIRAHHRLSSQALRSLIGIFVLVALASHAAAATFTLDSAASVITAVPTYSGSALGEQLPGSLSAQVQGTLEVTLLPGGIEFPGGGALDFIAQPGPFNPGAGPADFAAKSLFIAAVLRNGMFDLTGGPRSLVANNFVADTSAGFSAGIIDVATIAGPDSANLAGLSFVSSPAALGYIVPLGSLLEIHVPVDGTLVINTVSIHFTGQIVGTIVVPEPDSLALVGSAALLMGIARWRPRRRAID